jgi:hypothetical protein
MFFAFVLSCSNNSILMNIAAVIKFPLKGAGSEIQQKKGFFLKSGRERA